MDKSSIDSGKTLVFRMAAVEDAQAIVDYIHIVAGESDNLSFGADAVPITLENEIDYLKSLEGSKSCAHFVMLYDGMIVATSHLSTKSRARMAHVASLGISVRKDFWHLGIGHRLMDEMIRWAKEGGIIKKINLSVRSDNHHAIALYTKCGFIYIGTLHDEMRIDGVSVDLDMMELLF
jgi:RimJ/RimL family protein N-acetyltransferase